MLYSWATAEQEQLGMIETSLIFVDHRVFGAFHLMSPLVGAAQELALLPYDGCMLNLGPFNSRFTAKR